MTPEVQAALFQLHRELAAEDQRTLYDFLSELWTTVDIAKEYGFSSPTTVHTYAARHADFPAPVKRFGRIDVYWAPEIRAWFLNRRTTT